MQKLENNAICPVCGKPFRVCRNCGEAKIDTWKTVTDTLQCFKTFVALHGVYVTETLSKEDAKAQLADFKYEDIETYPDAVKEQLKGIIGVASKPKKTTTAAPKTEE